MTIQEKKEVLELAIKKIEDIAEVAWDSNVNPYTHFFIYEQDRLEHQALKDLQSSLNEILDEMMKEQ